MTVKQRLDAVMRWARRAVEDPLGELGRWERIVRWVWAVGLQVKLQLKKDQAPQMAGALAFRTLFAVFPVFIVGSVVLRAFVGAEGFQELVARVAIRVFGPEMGEGEGSLGAWMLELVAQAQGVNLAALGWLGSAVLVYSALSMLVTVEHAFNRVCRAPASRPWSRRLPVYWSALTLGPLGVGVLLFVNSRFVQATDGLPDWIGLLAGLRLAWGLAMTWLIMLGLYKLMPAVSMRFRSVAVGALVASLLLGVGREGLGAYLQGMQSIKLWGSVGLIPLFMFWVYLMWLVVLFGLQVAAMLQHLAVGQPPEELADDEPDDDRLADELEQLAERLRLGALGTSPRLADAGSATPRTDDGLRAGDAVPRG